MNSIPSLSLEQSRLANQHFCSLSQVGIRLDKLQKVYSKSLPQINRLSKAECNALIDNVKIQSRLIQEVTHSIENNQELKNILNETLGHLEKKSKKLDRKAQTLLEEVQKIHRVRGYDRLVTDGVTCKLSNGLISPSGGLQGWGTSEGMGNWMRSAWKNGDKGLFQSLLNSYFHVCQQAPDQMGLMPWAIDKSCNVDTSVSGGQNSATDSDEDIISTLIDAVDQNPDMTMTDTDGTTMKVSDMLRMAILNFVNKGCSTVNGLTGGGIRGCEYGWEFGPGFTDYFDPIALTKMINYCTLNGLTDQAIKLNTAMHQMMRYVSNELNSNNGLPSRDGDGSCSLPRLLYRLGEYCASPLSASDPELRAGALTTLQNLLTKGFESGTIKIHPSQWGTTIQMTVPGSYTVSNAQASAPLYLAMMLLSSWGELPSSIAEQLPAVKTAFDDDMNNQFNNLQSEDPSNYSNNGNYFGLTLGILCESLLQEYSLS